MTTGKVRTWNSTFSAVGWYGHFNFVTGNIEFDSCWAIKMLPCVFVISYKLLFTGTFGQMFDRTEIVIR